MIKRRATPLSRGNRPKIRRRVPVEQGSLAEPRWIGRTAGVLSLLALVAGVGGQYLGLWKDVFGGGKPSPAQPGPLTPGSTMPTFKPTVGSPSMCSTTNHGVALKLDRAPTRTAARVTATVSCALAPGDHLLWVVRKVTGTAANPHVRYTLRNDLDRGPGDYVYDADLRSTAPGSERTLFVVMMDSGTYQSVKSTTDSATGYVLMPSPPIASNTVLIKTPG